MGKEMTTQVQEPQNGPYRIDPSSNTPRHILIKLTKIKHKQQILKAVREKQQIAYKGIPVRITADFSTETLQAGREWQSILKVMKGEGKKKKNYSQGYPTQQGSYSASKEKSKALQTSKS